MSWKAVQLVDSLIQRSDQRHKTSRREAWWLGGKVHLCTDQTRTPICYGEPAVCMFCLSKNGAWFGELQSVNQLSLKSHHLRRLQTREAVCFSARLVETLLSSPVTLQQQRRGDAVATHTNKHRFYCFLTLLQQFDLFKLLLLAAVTLVKTPRINGSHVSSVTLRMAMSVGWSDHHFVPDWIISRTVEWIAMTSGSAIHVPLRIHCDNWSSDFSSSAIIRSKCISFMTKYLQN